MSGRGRGSRRGSAGRGRGGGGGGGPPPHLKGREIGLWYASRQRGRGGRGGGGGQHEESGTTTSEESSHRGRREGRGDQPPSELRGRKLGIWKSMQGAMRRIENLPRLELSPAKRTMLAELVETLNKQEGGAVVVPQQNSDFLRRYRQNLFDNALSAASGSIKMEALEFHRLPDLDVALKNELEMKQQSHKYQQMMRFREKLPAFQHKDNFLKLMRENQVVVISGETGCGKTTQCCQLILDEMIKQGDGSLCNIVCTQPRRISAISVAERVADERDERIGGKSVGYSIRLESRLPKSPRGTILFCTTGVIFQYMKEDPRLSKFTHIVVDEIHERDVLSDFLIAVLKDLITIRPDLKVVLMSATINANHFSRYFGDCPMFNIPGFTFPVTEYFLEDIIDKTRFVFEETQNSRYGRPPPYQRGGSSSSSSGGYNNKGRGNNSYLNDSDSEYQRMLEVHLRKLERDKTYPLRVLNELRKPESEELNLDLVEALLRHICQTDSECGAVLIFVPGWDQISKLNAQLESSGRFPASRFLIIPLHSLMPTVNQREVFNRPPPGVRKIIIATNIAETSITVDDVVHVIDTGKIKITNYNLSKNIESLDTEWVSQANATQRRGRAGRVKEGICYHMYNKARQMCLESFKKPEILRKKLEEVILQIKVLRLGNAEAFVRRLLDSPSEKAVNLALERLIQINALDKDENLTPLGFHLAHLPMDPQTGKMILMASIFGCVDPILTVAASLSFKDGFYIPLGKERNVDRVRKELSRDTKSDHMVTVYAMVGFETARAARRERDFCYQHYLSANTMQLLVNMKGQFAEHLHEMQFLSNSDFKSRENNLTSENIALIKAIICAGLYPNIAKIIQKQKRDGSYSFPKIATHEDGKVELHPKSVNSDERYYESPFLAYFQKMKSTSVFLYDTTMVSPFPLIFFGGQLSFRVEKCFGVVTIDRNVEFLIDKPIFELIQSLRKHLDIMLEEKVNNPGPTCWDESTKEGVLLRAIIELITSEYQEMFGEDRFASDSDGDY